jgi:hypothetical protein
MYSLEEEGKEATAQQLQEMIDLAKSENIKVIFYRKRSTAASPRHLRGNRGKDRAAGAAGRKLHREPSTDGEDHAENMQ